MKSETSKRFLSIKYLVSYKNAFIYGSDMLIVIQVK
jgi:hypothetical protein